MRNLSKILIILTTLIILSNCAPSAYRTASGGLAMNVDPWGDTSYSSIKAEADRACRSSGSGSSQNLREVIKSDGIAYAKWAFSCTNGSTASSYNSSYSSSNTYSSSYNETSPKLFYDSSSGGMKECNTVPMNGVCRSFKTYNSASYNKDTLFYDARTNSMRPCIGTVTFSGKCTAFGLYNRNLGSKNQLFYDSANNKMTTCRSISATGKCLAFDLIPKTGSTGGTYVVDDASNPYYKKVPKSSSDLIKLGNSMLSGSCTLGVNC